MDPVWSSDVFEVIDTSTHKYASTSVSGGGSIGNGQVARIESSTTFHSDQDIWLRNIDTEKEVKFEFSSYNIDVRPGHILLIVRQKETGKIERIFNKTTGEMHTAHGEFNERNTSMRIVEVFAAFALGVLSLVPIFGWLVIFFAFIRILFFVKPTLAEERFSNISKDKTYMVLMMLVVLTHILMTYMIMSRMINLSWWLGSFVLALCLITLSYSLVVNSIRFVKVVMKDLDKYVDHIQASHPALKN